jgi:agmatine/peptidylarginine deiminase
MKDVNDIGRRANVCAAFGLVALAALSAFGAAPARAEWDVDGIEELLPRHETPSEVELRRQLLRSPLPPTLLADPPPLAPVRNCAEWEPAVGVLIRYPLGLPYNLLRDFDDSNIIYVVVASGQFSAAQTNLTANGVDMSKVQWLVKPTDSIWTRDYGPQFVFDGSGDISIVDHVYNRPARPNDDLTPIEFGAQFGYPVVRHDMWHTGGNYMTDGADFSMSTDLVYDEAHSANGMSPAQVDQLMLDYYGIAPYNVVDDISLSGIHHIDTWGKFLDEETVLMKRVWQAHATYAALEQRATLIASLPASTGRNYSVFRVDCHNIGGGNPASYTNSLILNDRIYMPAFNSASNDTAAVNAYRAAIPGYDVRPYTYGGFITDDALHCRAIGIFDPGMLRVAHVPIREETEGPVPITAFVDDRSEAGISAVELHWRHDGGPWNVEAMTPAGADLYEGAIPSPTVPTAGTVVADYFIHAEDASGRTAGVPRAEPSGWFSFPMTVPTGAPVVADNVAARAPFPNPSAAGTSFEFQLKYPERVALAVYDVRGRLVRELVAEEVPAGLHRVDWDGRDRSGALVPAGTYFFRLRAAGIAYSRPVTVLR